MSDTDARPGITRIGSGEPLLLIHGIMHSRQAWDPLLEDLAASYEVLLLDLPGHGSVPPLDVEPTTDALVDHIEGLLDAEGLGRVHVVGSSLGGLLAIRMGERGRARSVTAFAPAGMVRGIEHPPNKAVLALVERLAGPLTRVPGFFDHAAGRELAAKVMFGRPAKVDPDYIRGALKATAAATDFTRIINAVDRVTTAGPIDVPVTIAWGTRDAILLPLQGRRWKQALPQARLIRLPGLGHLPMPEDPETCLNLIRRTVAVANVGADANPGAA